MRLAVALVLLLAAPARAEQWTAAVVGTATHVHGIQAGVLGGELELAWGGTVQLYGATDLALLQFWPTDTGATGAAARLGGGVRWLPRGRGRDTTGMVLQAGAGIAGFTWDREHLVRPDAEVGIGYDVIADGWRLRSLARFVLFEDDNVDGLACRGCVTSRIALDAGLGITMGIAW